MKAPHKNLGVVFTNKARCRDCNRCVRICPVKAIRVEQGQAQVEEQRCIACGTCIRECPQKAKTFRNDLENAMRLVKSGRPVAASLAPSFAAVFEPWQQQRLPSALRQLGFTFVAETAVAAYAVARETAKHIAKHPGQAHICSACPAVVNLIERYHVENVANLTPLVSPMIAHAQALKKSLPGRAAVIFIGPCVAKKSEADRSEYRDDIDCVLTFSELAEWLQQEDIDLRACEESDFDEKPSGKARFFPLVGGAVGTGGLSTDLLDANVISVSGFEEIDQVLSDLANHPRDLVIEPLFCQQGCINGPAVPESENLYCRRRNVLDYARKEVLQEATASTEEVNLTAHYKSSPLKEVIPEEQEIRRILEMTGKARPEDQLNCGACGYLSCREKAIAVVRGMAEPEMCIPYMRRLAERRTDRILETSPNGVVILDEYLSILSMNPAFRKMFMCSEATCGKPISVLMDPDPFEKLMGNQAAINESIERHDRYNLICHQITYVLHDEKQYVGIFVNITRTKANQEKLDRLRAQTVLQAQQLLEHQTAMAQQMADFLGENTARGEHLLDTLVKMTQEDESEHLEKKNWLKDMYTTK